MINIGLFQLSQKAAEEGTEQEAAIDLSTKVAYSDMGFHNAVIFQFMLCAGVSVALGLLTLWHARLISRGETSIEAHINARERKRYKKKGLVK